MQGLTEDDLIDFTPELRAEALEIVKSYRLGPIFNPPIELGHPSGLRSFVSCPSGASNIFGPTSADPEAGEHLWAVPNGDLPERIRNHPALQDMELPNTERRSHPVTMVMKTLVITAEGTGGTSRLHALDKQTGERLGTVALPASGQYGMMGFMHEGQQCIVVQVAGPDLPGSLAALRLPE